MPPKGELISTVSLTSPSLHGSNVMSMLSSSPSGFVAAGTLTVAGCAVLKKGDFGSTNLQVYSQATLRGGRVGGRGTRRLLQNMKREEG